VKNDVENYADIEAETAVLAALIQKPSRFLDLAPKLGRSVFYNNAHAEIYEAIEIASETAKVGEDPYDIYGVNLQARKLGFSEHANTPTDETISQYLHTLSNYPLVGDPEIHVEALTEASIRRDVRKGAQRLLEAAANPSLPIKETVSPLMDGIVSSVTSAMSNDGTVEPFGDVFAKFIDRMENPQEVDRIPTGFKELDRDYLSGGMEASRVMTIGARPGAGKTAFALSVARQAAFRERKHVLFASFEMNPEQLMRRIIAAEADVYLSNFNNPNDIPAQRKAEVQRKIANAYSLIQQTTNLDMESANIDMSKGGLYFWDKAETTIQEFILKVREMHKRGIVDMVIVDYLQLMRWGGRAESRQLEVSNMMRALKTAALSLEIPFIVLSQLNREVTSRADQRPQLSDLRESGSVEQDSDIVLLLWRKDLNDRQDGQSHDNLLDLAIEKNRDGAMGHIQLVSQLEKGRFSDFSISDTSGFGT
jgi:replicative DNA helicase